MSQGTALAREQGTGRYPIERFLADIAGIDWTMDATDLKRRSRDYYWYSPILNEELKDKLADVIVTPKDESEVIRVAAACARHRIPLTPRGGATGNYGQCVPMDGGVVLDMSMFNKIEWQKPGKIRVEAGAKIWDIDAATRPNGWELRMHPSTKRASQIGGFVAGGSGGAGSVTYGGLREPGNILAARIVTLEEKPRVIELRGDAAQKISRAYGTTGIITVLEMPLAPALPWIDVIVAFDDFIEAVRFGRTIAMADGITKKLISPIEWPLPQNFAAYRPHCPDGKSVLFAMIGEMSLESFETLLESFKGKLTYKQPAEDVLNKVPLYEHTWNHTTLQQLKVDRGVTYLQCLYPHDRLVEAVTEVGKKFEGEVTQHLEFLRINGVMTASGLPVIHYRSRERLYEIVKTYESCGVMIADPHVITLEDGSRYKRVDADQLGFKHEVDPMGLLNPGKMRSFVPKNP
ncbi:FAD-binding oxidoreductase [Rhodoplanes sp. Z2-YC6860]|uniref:FAD-binding oxidoreductase n=1 Tax=Rhodoplanes sp. Z2-YC6860 TaxID=674703 RepID=UPI00078B6B90|nr:FAD-binding oxidoreductase [Rhodoplanes sp. Z2-YC6860]AMN40673.1 FAD linked oxidase domain-containing protein [Rhodoplanes sp. Z2-YC6860]